MLLSVVPAVHEISHQVTCIFLVHTQAFRQDNTRKTQVSYGIIHDTPPNSIAIFLHNDTYLISNKHEWDIKKAKIKLK